MITEVDFLKLKTAIARECKHPEWNFNKAKKMGGQLSKIGL